MATETQIAFQGTDAQRELAQAAFEVMRRKGVLFGANTPIKMSCEAIVAALIKPGGPMAGRKADQIKLEIEAALALNADVFAHDGEEFITTKSGHAPATGKSDNLHTFKDRLNAQAQQLDSEGAAQYRASVIDLSATRDVKNFASEDMEEEEEAVAPQPHHHAPRSHHHSMPELRSIAANIIAAEDIPPEWLPPPPEPEIEEAEPEIEVELVEEEAEPEADAPAVPAATTPTTPPAPRTTPSETPAVAVPATPQTRTTPAEQQPKPTETTPAAQPQVSVTEQATQASQAATPAQQAATAPAAPAPAPVPATTLPRRPAAPTPPPAPVITGPVEVMITTSEGEVTIDLVEPVEEILLDERVENALVAMVEKGLENDARIVRFGADLFPEEGLDRLSKGDHRRIKDYLEEPETGGLASDRDIMADVFNRRTDHPDYERQRFSINYRMLKEKKDFEFVGIDTDRLWVSAGSSPVSLPLRKPAEVGQDYRYLEDATIEDDETAEAAPGPIPYSLTYYEYEQGVLPYDSRFKKAFPGALFEDQRASLIRFEIPALYGAIITELRYPTGNRGGFIMGFRELFSQHMVPGARFSIVPTDRGGDVFEIHFTRTDEREENLLQQDERRGRYVFRPVSFTIETDPELFLIQDKFGKLHNHKKLDESERKRPEVILANTFEAIGEDNGGKLWAAIDDIYAVANIERPISRAWLLQLLSGTTYPAFYPDESVEGAYFYDPEKKGT